MVVLVAIPLFTAYGVVYDGGWGFPVIAIAVMAPMLVIPTAIGSAGTLMLVNLFPARRTRDLLGVLSVVAAGGVVLFLRLARPEQLAQPEGFRSLIEFITVLRTPTSPFLPSEWVAKAIVGFLHGRPDWLALYLLWSTAGAAVVLGATLHRRLFHTGFTNAQEGVQRAGRSAGRFTLALHFLLRPLNVRRRELVLKEFRVFFRDTTQWSQLILLAVLVIVYVYNVKFLPLRGEGMTFFLVNAVPFLNLILAGFVLASIAARFLFPGVSLEGRTLWLLQASPIAIRDLLWAKFWVGTLPLLGLALIIVMVTNHLLQVSAFMSFVSIGTITLLTFALAGLALGLGALFPQFDTANPAQIPTSFGGLIYMMSAIAVIAIVIVLEAGPVYRYLAAQAFRVPIAPTDMFWGFGWAALVCIVATLGPIRLAITRLERIER
jgi:ABC-2 type transport system permease protein